MTPLYPPQKLTQVVFVHDYLQLIFEDQSFSLYGPVTVVGDQNERAQSEAGFCDKLVGLIGQLATATTIGFEGKLELVFEQSSRVTVQGGLGPETWQWNRGDKIVVGR